MTGLDSILPAAALPFPEIDPVVFALPPFELFGTEIVLAVRWYALAYIAGLALGWFLIRELMRRPALWPANSAPMPPEKTDDLLFWMTIGVVVGGRLGFILFYSPEILWTDPVQALRIWEGGMAFHGGMLGVVLAGYLFARNNGYAMWSLGDAVAAVTPIGLFFGRIANFINGELWGRPTDVSWGMVFPQITERLVAPDGRVLPSYADRYPWLLVDGQNVPRHPSQLYEAALEGLLLFAVISFLIWRRDALKRPGVIVGTFLLGYGLARGFCEFFRQWNVELGPDAVLFGVEITRGQTLSLPMVLAGAAILYWALKRDRTAEA
ncbi:MAG: prolipoprotein diacylglyceryl transferase [Pseudomonadota bacterium]